MTPQEVIAALRVLGWSEVQLAGYLNVNQSTVSRIASGEIRWPRYTTVDKLRELLEHEQNATRVR